jgi:hypothetical protein
MPCTLARRTGSVMLLVLSSAAAAQTPAPDQPPAPAGGKPLWEAGLVAGGGRVSDYPGAGQSHVRGLVAPFVVYRGRLLNVDGEGIRGRLIDHPDFELQLTASAAFNARDNDARDGMPELDYLFGIGPQLVYKGLRRLPGAPALHVKARALFSTDFRHIDGRGAAFEPELRWRFERIGGTPASLVVGQPRAAPLLLRGDPRASDTRAPGVWRARRIPRHRTQGHAQPPRERLGVVVRGGARAVAGRRRQRGEPAVAAHEPARRGGGPRLDAVAQFTPRGRLTHAGYTPATRGALRVSQRGVSMRCALHDPPRVPSQWP